MTDVRSNTIKAFEEKFGSAPAMQAYAPGRVNIIGEHTDYNGGHVFPCALTIFASSQDRPIFDIKYTTDEIPQITSTLPSRRSTSFFAPL